MALFAISDIVSNYIIKHYETLMYLLTNVWQLDSSPPTASANDLEPWFDRITSGDAVKNQMYEITVIGGNWTNLGAPDNNLGTQFIANDDAAPTSWGGGELAKAQLLGNIVTISGAVTINTLNAKFKSYGDRVRLIFQSTPQVTNEAGSGTDDDLEIVLDGGANITAAADDELELELRDDDKWYHVGGTGKFALSVTGLFYETTVGASGAAFTTGKAAIDAGFIRILWVDATTEVANWTLATDEDYTFGSISPNIGPNMGDNIIIGNPKNVTVDGLDFDYTHTTGRNLFTISASFISKKLEIKNCVIDDNSATDTNLIQQSAGILVFENNQFTVPNLAGEKIDIRNTNTGKAYIKNNKFKGSGTTTTIFANDSAGEIFHSNNVFMGTWYVVKLVGGISNINGEDATINSNIQLCVENTFAENLKFSGTVVRLINHNIKVTDSHFDDIFGDAANFKSFVNCIFESAIAAAPAVSCNNWIFDNCVFKNNVSFGPNIDFVKLNKGHVTGTLKFRGEDCGADGRTYATGKVTLEGVRNFYCNSAVATGIEIELNGDDAQCNHNHVGTTNGGAAFIDNNGSDNTIIGNRTEAGIDNAGATNPIMTLGSNSKY